MKKIFLAFIIGLLTLDFGLWTTFAYSPTPTDIQQLNHLQTQLNHITSGNNQDLRNFYYQLKNLQQQFTNDARLNYMLNHLKQDLYTKLYTQKTLAKIQSRPIKQQFVEQFAPNISIDTDVVNSCTGRYNTLDDISFAYNFPTALTIATRYKESTCGYYLPIHPTYGSNGPFQIISKDYGTGPITEPIFIQSVIDFIEFSKAKHIQYKTRLGINLTYTGFQRTGLINHGALYNGARITGSTDIGYIALPNNPKYLYDGYGLQYSGVTRYGLIAKFIKILDRELQNKY